MSKCSCKNAINNRKGIMALLGLNNPMVARPEQSDTAEPQENPP